MKYYIPTQEQRSIFIKYCDLWLEKNLHNKIVKILPHFYKNFLNKEQKQQLFNGVLVKAAVQNDIILLKILIFIGVDINQLYKSKSALYHSIYMGHDEISQLLIRHKSRLDFLFNKKSVFDVAIENNRDQVAAMLLSYNFHFAASKSWQNLKHNNADRCNDILAKSNAIRSGGILELIDINQESEVIALIDYFVEYELNKGDLSSYNLINLFKLYPHVMKYLFEQEITIGKKVFVEKIFDLYSYELVKAVVDSEINLNQVYTNGKRFLDYAITIKSNRLLHLLLINGVDYLIADENSVTYFMNIVQWCNRSLLEKIYSKYNHVELNTVDLLNRGATYYAAFAGNIQALEFLFEQHYELSPYSRDDKGQSILDLVIDNNLKHILDWLQYWNVIDYIKKTPGVEDFENFILSSVDKIREFAGLVYNLEDAILEQNELYVMLIIEQIQLIFEGIEDSNNRFIIPTPSSPHKEEDDDYYEGGGASFSSYLLRDDNEPTIISFVGQSNSSQTPF
jgi:hypothetical protein